MSVDSGLLTPTLKMRRDVGKTFYQREISEMYAQIKRERKGGVKDGALIASKL